MINLQTSLRFAVWTLCWAVLVTSLFSQDTTQYELSPTLITDSLSQRFHTQATTKVFQKDSLGNFGVNGLSSEAVFRQVEGMYVKNYGGHGGIKTVSFRGFAAQQTTLSINGVSYQNPQSSVVNFGFFALDNMDKITIQKSPNALIDNPLAGNIGFEVQKVPKYFRWKLGWGSFGERIAGGGCALNGKRFGLQANFQYVRAKDDYTFDLNGESGKRKNAGFENTQYQLYYTYQAKPNIEISAFANGFRAKQGVPTPVVRGFSGISSDSLTQNDLFGFVQAKISPKEIRSAWLPTQTSWVVGLHRNEMRYLFQQEEQLYENNEYFGQVNMTHLLSHQIVQTSLQYQDFTLEGNHLAIRFQPVAKVLRRQFNAAIQHKWFLYEGNEKTPAFRLESSFRMNYLTNYRFLPNLSTTFSCLPINQKSSVFLHLHYANRIPSFNELYYFGYGNADLQPEKVKSIEISYLRNATLLGIDFLLKTTAFYNQTQNKIIAIPINPATWSTFAIGKTQTRGAEISLEAQWEKTQLYANYTLQYAQDMTQSNRPFLPYTPVEVVNYGLKTSIKKWQIYLNNHYSSWRFINLQNNQAAFLPVYHLADVGLNYSYLRKKWTYNLDFQCENVFNTKYEVVKSYPMPRRSVRVSLVVKRK
ncbi:MAG: TonB-dependent receptor plug domain-containing protein [Bacteroidia bacterium]